MKLPLPSSAALRERALSLVQRSWNVLQIARYWRRAGTEELLWIIQTVGVDYGHIRSDREQTSIAQSGHPVPWYTYPAIEYLTQFDFSDRDGFEFGGGNSSQFWARRCRTLTTVESDASWHATIVGAARPNQQIIFEQDPARYAATVRRDDRKYGLIIVDGLHRKDCAAHAVECLAPGGIIIFDNTDWWPKTAEFLRSKGLLQVDFTGIGPINRYAWTTSIFFAEGASLPLATGRQPEPGISSIRQRNVPE
jgi:hypothetical protein